MTDGGCLWDRLYLYFLFNVERFLFSDGELEIPGTDRLLMGQHKLNYMDLDLLSKLAFNRGFYDRAIEWMEVAIRFAKTAEIVPKKSYITSLEDTMKTLKQKHDLVLDKKGPRGDTWRTYTLPFDAKLYKKKKYKKYKALLPNKSYSPKPKIFEHLNQEYLWDQFNVLCRGEQIRAPKHDMDLRCKFLHYSDPYLRLGPFKLEEKNHAPFVSVLHEFMYDHEADEFRERVSTLVRPSEAVAIAVEPASKRALPNCPIFFR